MKRTSVIQSLIIGLFFSAGCAANKAVEPAGSLAQQQEAKNTDGSAKKAQAQLSPEEMEKAWAKVASPGAAHEQLKPLIGKFSTTVTCLRDPSGKPNVTKGSSSNSWILGGRFVEENFAGKMYNKPFTGRGLLGFDNVKGEYVSIWTDTMSTGVFNQKGTYDANAKSLTLQGEYTDPATGQPVKTKSITRIISKDRHVFEMYDLLPNGQEVKSLEIDYVRKKGTGNVAKEEVKPKELKKMS